MPKHEPSRRTSLAEVVLGPGGVVANGLAYLKDHPVLVFPLTLSIVIAVLLIGVGAGGSDTTEAIKWLLGFGALALILYVALTLIGGRKPAGQRLKLQTVTKIEDLPPLAEEVDWADGESVLSWLKEFLERARFLVDAGSREGVVKGDYFVIVGDPSKAEGLRRNETSGLRFEAGSMLKAVEILPKVSVCKLESWDYKRFLEELPRRLEEIGEDTSQLANLIAPIRPGDVVVAIPQEEKAGRDQIDYHYSRAINPKLPQDEQRINYAEMVRKADSFLAEHANGFFAAEALFQRGYGQFQLGKFDDSIDTFELFLDRYPFDPQADGARHWIEKGGLAGDGGRV
jgi:hypothetical protein